MINDDRKIRLFVSTGPDSEQTDGSNNNPNPTVEHNEVKVFNQESVQRSGLYSKSYYSDYSDY
jgi:hypothetical protein